MFGRKVDVGSRESGGEERLETLIGGGCKVSGTVQSSGSLRVEGQVEGEILAQGDLIVGEGAKVKAEVKARNATIAGEVVGNVETTGTLELLPKARVYGDVRVGKLSVQPGAILDGICHMAQEKADVTL